MLMPSQIRNGAEPRTSKEITTGKFVRKLPFTVKFNLAKFKILAEIEYEKP